MRSRKPDDSHTVERVVRAQWRGLAAIALTSFLGGLAEAAFLVIITQTGLAVAQGDNTLILGNIVTVTTMQASALALGLIVVRGGLALINAWVSAQVQYVVSLDYRNRLAETFLGASWGVQQGEPTGRLQQLIGDYSSATLRMLVSVTTAISAVLSLVALLITATVVSPVSTALVLAILVCLGLVLAPLRRAIRSKSDTVARIGLDSAAAVSELGSLTLEMQTFGVRQQFIHRLRSVLSAEAGAQRSERFVRSLMAPLYTTLAFVALVTGLAAASTVDVTGIADIGAVMLLMLRSLGYGQAAQTAIANLISTAPYNEILDTTIERYQAEAATSGERQIETIGAIEARKVTFSYVEGTPALYELSFDIAAGEHIGVVGPSGSGKSTLVQLLLGLRLPDSGTLRIGGVDLTDIDRSSLTPHVAFVAQDPSLFSGTIAENIAFFRDIDRATIEDAAHRARLDPDLSSMPDGLDTRVGERGTQLSGGQRQRIAIARALAGRPALLVLDEPTSALDAVSELAIRNSLAALKGSVTVIVIAHRLSTLDHCDRVMVIEGGRLEEFDQPERVAERNAYFREALAVASHETSGLSDPRIDTKH